MKYLLLAFLLSGCICLKKEPLWYKPGQECTPERCEVCCNENLPPKDCPGAFRGYR